MSAATGASKPASGPVADAPETKAASVTAATPAPAAAQVGAASTAAAPVATTASANAAAFPAPAASATSPTSAAGTAVAPSSSAAAAAAAPAKPDTVVAAPAAKAAAPAAAAPKTVPAVGGVGCCGSSSKKAAAAPASQQPTAAPKKAASSAPVATGPKGGSPGVASGLYIVQADALAHTLLTYLQAVVSDVAMRRGIVHVAVSGGSLVPLLGQALRLAFENRVNLHTEKWMVWYVDERHVPHSHPDSNHRAMCEHVYGAPGWVRGGSKQVQPVNTSLPLADSAAEYEERLLREFCARPGSVPRFDVVLLGLGEDGHTASLFPGSPALQLDITRDPARAEAEARRIAAVTGRPAAVRVRLVCGVEDAPKPPPSRVTLTLSAINAANNVGLFAGGAGKAPAAAAVLEQVSTRFSARNRGAPLPVSEVDSHLPAALIGLMDNAWPAAYFLDAEAASRIAPAGSSPAAAARATSPTGAGATGSSSRAAGAAAAYPHVPAATPAAAAASTSPSSSGVPDKKAVF